MVFIMYVKISFCEKYQHFKNVLKMLIYSYLCSYRKYFDSLELFRYSFIQFFFFHWICSNRIVCKKHFSIVIWHDVANGNSRATFLISHWCVNEIMICKSIYYFCDFSRESFSWKELMISEKIIAGVYV